jgi:hypothetical protein
MAMGSTNTVNITQKMMQDIVSAVSDYRAKTNALAEQLDGVVNGLIPGNFSGSAADGFKEFYTKNIVPANGEGLKDLLDAVEGMANGILESIPGGNALDDQLGDGNRQ